VKRRTRSLGVTHGVAMREILVAKRRDKTVLQHAPNRANAAMLFHMGEMMASSKVWIARP
jgi:hypothetical protein